MLFRFSAFKGVSHLFTFSTLGVKGVKELSQMLFSF